MVKEKDSGTKHIDCEGQQFLWEEVEEDIKEQQESLEKTKK